MNLRLLLKSSWRKIIQPSTPSLVSKSSLMETKIQTKFRQLTMRNPRQTTRERHSWYDNEDLFRCTNTNLIEALSVCWLCKARLGLKKICRLVWSNASRTYSHTTPFISWNVRGSFRGQNVIAIRKLSYASQPVAFSGFTKALRVSTK